MNLTLLGLSKVQGEQELPAATACYSKLLLPPQLISYHILCKLISSHIVAVSWHGTIHKRETREDNCSFGKPVIIIPFFRGCTVYLNTLFAKGRE